MTPPDLNSEQSLSNEAIATLRKTLAENSQSPQAYHDLGAALAQHGNIEAAIACYRRAVALDSSYQHQCFLDQLQPIQSWSVKPQQLHCIQEQKTRLNDQGHLVSLPGNQGYVFQSPHLNILDGVYCVKVNFGFPQKRALGKKQQQHLSFKFDVVAPNPHVLYQTQISSQKNQLQFYLEVVGGTQTEFRFFAQGKAFVVKGIEFSLIYRPTLNSKGAFYYTDLARELKLKGLQDKADVAYGQAINLLSSPQAVEELATHAKVLPQQPEGIEAYTELQELLRKQGKEKQAQNLQKIIENLKSFTSERPKNWYQVALELAEKGRLDDAIACFQNAQNKPTVSEIYEKIWNRLHYLGCFDENNPIYQGVIQSAAALEYFNQTSQYQVIGLDTLTDAQKVILEQFNLSVNNLELIKTEHQALSKIYTNCFSKKSNPRDLDEFDTNASPQNSFMQFLEENQDTSNSNIEQQPFQPQYFQQSLVETGYVYSVCPWSGQVLRSDQSFYIQPNQQSLLFYRFSGQEIFYLFSGLWSGEKLGIYIPKLELVITFNSYKWRKVISDKNTFIINYLKSYFVSHWKLVNAYINNFNKKSTVALFGVIRNLGHYFWNEVTGVYTLRKNHLLEKIDRFLVGSFERSIGLRDLIPEIPPEKILQLKDDASIFNAILEDNYCAVRVTDFCLSEEVVNQISAAARAKSNPSFLESVEEARHHFPLLWVNLRSHNKSWLNQVEGYANIIQKLSEHYPNLAIVFDGYSSEKADMDKIISLIPSSIKTYNGLECELYESIVWANAINAYIAIIGSGLTLVTWLANKPGVAHADKAHYAQMSAFWMKVRKNLIRPKLVPVHLIQQQESGTHGWLNYNVDWQIIYNLIVEVLQKIDSKER